MVNGKLVYHAGLEPFTILIQGVIMKVRWLMDMNMDREEESTEMDQYFLGISSMENILLFQT
jgi:hypothetical protein